MVKFLKRRWPWLSLLVLGAVLAAIFWPHTSKAPGSQTSPTKQIAKQTAFDKQRYPRDHAASLWVVVNKGRQLPASYAPNNTGSFGLRLDMLAALNKLFQAASQAGVSMTVTSGYRSFGNQSAVYNGYVNQYGQAQADTFSARPGHSEHQTGLAADLQPADGRCRLDQCFGQTAEGKWLAANTYKYGFIIRYGKGQDKVTGYEYEPWHVRYVGTALAAQLHKTGQTLEQFFGLPIYTSYPANSLVLK